MASMGISSEIVCQVCESRINETLDVKLEVVLKFYQFLQIIGKLRQL